MPVPRTDDLHCHCCSDSIQSESDLYITNCGHSFHQKCLDKPGRTLCPVCKESLTHLTGIPSDSSGASTSKGAGRTPVLPISVLTRSQTKRLEDTSSNMVNPGDNTAPLPQAEQLSMADSIKKAIAEAMAAAMSEQTVIFANYMKDQTDKLTQAITTGLNINSNSPQHSVQFQNNLDNSGLPADNNSVGRESSGSENGQRSQIMLSELRPDKITQTIANWKLKFSGKGSLSIDDFLYRVEAVALQTLNGDLDLLAGFASNLFEGAASEWYWRYHKKVRCVKWQPLCMALKAQFKDSRTDRNIRSEIEQRKQRSSESFDDFYGVIAALADKLTEPLSETALVEILRANLLPDIQHEILYETTSTVVQLRALVLKREIFMKTLPKSQPYFSRPAPRKIVCAVDPQIEEDDCENEDFEDEFEVSALDFPCWNCGVKGHRYQECVAERKVFCYGCGKANTYKPSCSTCLAKPAKNYLARVQPKSTRRPRSSQEDTSN